MNALAQTTDSGASSPEELISKATGMVESNNYDELKTLIYPKDEESASQLDDYLNVLKLAPRIREFLDKGHQKFNYEFETALDRNVQYTLKLLSGINFAKANEFGIFETKDDYSICSFSYPDDQGLKIEGRFALMKIDGRWYIPFSSKEIGGSASQIYTTMDSYLKKGMEAIDDSGSIEELKPRLDELLKLLMK